jgi:hypothetical protein
MVELTRLFRDPYGLHRRNRERGRWLGWGHYRLWRGTKLGDRTQDFATITKDNAQVWQDREIDPVLGKTLRVFGHAELFQPVGNLLHRAPCPADPSGFWTSRTGNFTR